MIKSCTAITASSIVSAVDVFELIYINDSSTYGHKIFDIDTHLFIYFLKVLLMGSMLTITSYKKSRVSTERFKLDGICIQYIDHWHLFVYLLAYMACANSN